MAESLLALIVMHEPMMKEAFAFRLRAKGYNVETCDYLDEMIGKIGTGNYGLIAMDLNFENPASTDISPSKAVYDIVKNDAASGKTIFIGLSGNNACLSAAQEYRMPAFDKTLALNRILEQYNEKFKVY